MKNKKTQSTMIVMAATLGMSGILQPITAYAQEEQAPDTTQPVPAQETTTITQSEDTFTEQDIQQALANFTYTNETTKSDIRGHLNKTFSGKKYGNEIIRSFLIKNFVKVNATFENKGSFCFNVIMFNNHGNEFVTNLPIYSFEIPRLQPDYASMEKVKAAITEELKAYPYHNGTKKEEINQYLEPAFIGKSVALDNTNVQIIRTTEIEDMQIQEATIDTNGSITLNVKIKYNTREEFLYNLVFDIPSQYPLANIPDEEFRKFLLVNVDKDGDKNLSLSERNAVETLTLSKTTIDDLSGIEIFKNLKNLYCNDQVRILDVSQNDKLEVLHCSNSQITTLDLRNNPALQSLDCSGAKQLDTLILGNHPSLKHVHAHETRLSTINTSECPILVTLTLGNTQITSVDVSNNPFLKTLALGSTQITDLDVSRNPDLIYLDLNATKKLKGINISTNLALQALNLNSSSIFYLDARGNTNLTMLDVENTNLAYLTLNAIPSEQFNINPAPVIQTQIEVETFNIKDIFPGIDISRISNWQNASFDTTTGIFSEYLPNTTITYEYAILPTVNKRATPVTMKVTLQIPKAQGHININRASNVVYTGSPVANPTDIKVQVGAADPIFFYHMLVDGNWVPIQGNPVEVGTYRVDARVPENEHYLEAETSEEVTFEITKAENKWNKGPTIENWTYGEQPEDASAEARFGNVDITYSNSKTGIYTDTVPTDAGTWYMKASVEGTNNYTGLTYIREFTIHQATNAWDKGPSIEDWMYGEQPMDASAEAKFGKVDITYSNSKTGIYTDQVPTDAGTWYMKASVEATNNYTGLNDVVSFFIQPKNATENPDIKIPDIKDDKDLEDLVIKDGENELEKGKDYEVDKQQKDEETTVTITFKDNYTGEVTKTYTTKKEEQKETPKEESKKELTPELKKETIKKTGGIHQSGLFGLWSTLLAGCGIVIMKKQKKEMK